MLLTYLLSGRLVKRQRFCWMVIIIPFCRFSSLLNLNRIMRRTGKLYTLTLISAVFTIYSSLSIASWTPDTADFHLWVDIIPQGFGMASLITTTLIVSSLFRTGVIALILTASKAMIAGVYKEDMAVATGSMSDDLRTAHVTLIEFHSYISVQDDWSSSWGKPERYCSSSRLARKIKGAHPRSWISPGERLRCGFILGSSANSCAWRSSNK